MARFEIRIAIPEFPDRWSAERWAALEYGPRLRGVYSVASEEVAREERAALLHNARLKLRDSDEEL